MMGQRLIKFVKHPIVLITIITLIMLVACGAFALNVLRHLDLGMPFGEPYMLTGDVARSSTEAYIDVSLADGRDFYHYYSVTPGESHDLMRFTVPPAVLDKILANPSTLCFGTQLQPRPNENTITFMTPVMPYKSGTTTEATARPTPDYLWLTPFAGHIYKGASCSMKKGRYTTYYRIRVDESDPQFRIVWLEVYSG
jgi:hypothetical protein